MDALESKDRHQPVDGAPVDAESPDAEARAAARLVAAARRVRSARETGAARRVEPVGVPSDPSAPPISVQRGPVLIAAAS
jgi:hypothetical protein